MIRSTYPVSFRRRAMIKNAQNFSTVPEEASAERDAEGAQQTAEARRAQALRDEEDKLRALVDVLKKHKIPGPQLFRLKNEFHVPPGFGGEGKVRGACHIVHTDEEQNKKSGRGEAEQDPGSAAPVTPRRPSIWTRRSSSNIQAPLSSMAKTRPPRILTLKTGLAEATVEVSAESPSLVPMTDNLGDFSNNRLLTLVGRPGLDAEERARRRETPHMASSRRWNRGSPSGSCCTDGWKIRRPNLRGHRSPLLSTRRRLRPSTTWPATVRRLSLSRSGAPSSSLRRSPRNRMRPHNRRSPQGKNHHFDFRRLVARSNLLVEALKIVSPSPLDTCTLVWLCKGDVGAEDVRRLPNSHEVW